MRHERNHDAVAYSEYRERGWSTASSEVESGHRSVVQVRLKLPGTWWHPDNVPYILALRMVKANGATDGESMPRSFAPWSHALGSPIPWPPEQRQALRSRTRTAPESAVYPEIATGSGSTTQGIVLASRRRAGW